MDLNLDTHRWLSRSPKAALFPTCIWKVAKKHWRLGRRCIPYLMRTGMTVKVLFSTTWSDLRTALAVVWHCQEIRYYNTA
jgi:hypothetical protein